MVRLQRARVLVFVERLSTAVIFSVRVTTLISQWVLT
jgi:hypothetical protein